MRRPRETQNSFASIQLTAPRPIPAGAAWVMQYTPMSTIVTAPPPIGYVVGQPWFSVPVTVCEPYTVKGAFSATPLV